MPIILFLTVKNILIVLEITSKLKNSGYKLIKYELQLLFKILLILYLNI